MKIKVEKDSIFFEICFELILFTGMFAGYTDHVRGANIIFFFIMGFMGYRYRLIKKSFFSHKKDIVIIATLGTLMAFNIFLSVSNRYLISNLIGLIYSIEYGILLVFLSESGRLDFSSMLRKNFIFLNIFWIANLFVLSKQISGSGFMIKDYWFTSNSFYKDQCAGLFGNSATHQLTFYSSFMLAYDWSAENYLKINKIEKFVIKTFIICTELYMCLLSKENDNTAFFILLPITLAYLILIQKQENVRSIRKVFFRGLQLLLIILVLCSIAMNIPTVRTIFKDHVIDKISTIISNAGNSHALGGSERLAIWISALRGGYGWSLGKGIGYTGWFDGTNLGFSHFGISDIGTVTTLCGIWVYIIYTYIYSAIGTRLITRKHEKFFISFLVFIYLIIITVYSNIFIVSMSALWIFMLFLAMGESYKFNNNVER